ncbi:hypothetical protein [Niabella beijingensis]|uniref:hypothetical protein n=1 Tax=Niabella beijingensis TaxID=2872700 RepID=UPI001CC04506|nr:hypothetical protein [Niabella beijingensis]MBZ4190423.1 hypothetical protein [Niabella beijingensis]
MKMVPKKIVLRCLTRSLAVLMLLVATAVQGQALTNRLHGYFQAMADTTLYNYFAFDGNGKVDIMGMGDGYYFQKGDSVIVYPDKSIFKFLLKGDTLYGASEWVNGGVWRFVKDTAVENKRTDPEAADRIARLMNRYYELKGRSERGFLTGTDDRFSLKMKNLCDSGLSKACLDYAGLKILEGMGGIMALLNDKKTAEKKEADPGVLALIEKAIGMGDLDGYAVLGGYYAALQNVNKAKEVFEKGGELGCRRCVWAAFSITMEEEHQNTEAAEKGSSTEE